MFNDGHGHSGEDGGSQTSSGKDEHGDSSGGAEFPGDFAGGQPRVAVPGQYHYCFYLSITSRIFYSVNGLRGRVSWMEACPRAPSPDRALARRSGQALWVAVDKLLLTARAVTSQQFTPLEMDFYNVMFANIKAII